MIEPVKEASTQVLARERGLTEQAIERRRRIVKLEPEDLARIASIREVVLGHVDEFTSLFFDYLAGFESGEAEHPRRSSGGDGGRRALTWLPGRLHGRTHRSVTRRRLSQDRVKWRFPSSNKPRS